MTRKQLKSGGVRGNEEKEALKFRLEEEEMAEFRLEDKLQQVTDRRERNQERIMALFERISEVCCRLP